MSSVHQPNVVAKDREQILTKKGQATRKGSACLGTGQRKHEEAVTSAANRLIGEVVQSQRRPLLGPSPG